MIRQRVSLAVAGAVVATTGLTAGLMTSAIAAPTPTNYDPSFTPTTGDLSGAGSDTTEIALDYLSKGHDGIEGFNGTKSTGRIASFAAGSADNVSPSSVVLKTGVASITRPNGSSAGKGLLYGSANNASLDFARSSSGLSSAEVSAGLQQSAFAVDGLKVAVSSSSTNAPASISGAQLVKIYDGTYKTWGQVPGYTGPAPSAAITALIPQAGSGTRKFFEDQLKPYNGNVAVTLSGVKETQEHSDIDLKGNPNAIAPFSTGRAKSTTTVKLLDASESFTAQRALYNVVRTSDRANAAKGALLDQAFGPTGFVCSPAAKPLIEAAGFEQLAPTSASGACGTFGQTDVTNFRTSNTAAAVTTTSLSAVAQNGGSVRLTATVSASSGLPSGKVIFLEGANQVGTAQVIGGAATLTLPNTALGNHTYTATYNPTNAATYLASKSGASTTNVLASSGLSVSAASGTYGVSRVITVNGSGGAANGAVSVSVPGVASATVNLVNGVGSMSVPATAAVGNRAVTASYAGNASTFGSSASTTLSISTAKTTSTLKINKKSIKAKKSAKATVTVKISGSSLKANGKVTLKAGSKTIGKGTVKNGKATVTLKKLKKGSLKIKATFAGSNNYGSSASKTVKLKVTK
jgi:ABC-type phosphate transport system substrate-binding protein